MNHLSSTKDPSVKLAMNNHGDAIEANVIEIVDIDEYNEEKLEEIATDNVENDDAIKFKVMTWNLWCMIFTPRTLSNPHRCGNYVKKIAGKEDWKSYDGLIVCSFQELWSWNTGIFPPCLLPLIGYIEYIPYLGILISFIFQFVSALIGLLPIFKCLPIRYNPKKTIARILNQFVPFSYYDTKIPLRHILDNGLLILSNKKADKYGSFGYTNHACDDSLAYKGFLYTYYKQYHTLVINTHLQSAGDGAVRLLQIEELKKFIANFDDLLTKEIESVKHIDDDYRLNLNKKLKIIATGDWNVDMTNHNLITQHQKRKQQLVQDMELQIRIQEIEKSVQSDSTVPSANTEIASTVSTTTSAGDQEEQKSSFTEIDIGIQNESQSTTQSDKNINVNIKTKLCEDLNSDAKLRKTKDTATSRLSHRLSRLSSGSPLPIIHRSRTYADLPNIFGSTFVKCNGCLPTCKNEQWGCLDHILCNFEFVSFNEEIHGKEAKLSDHLMIKNEFISSHSNLKNIQ